MKPVWILPLPCRTADRARIVKLSESLATTEGQLAKARATQAARVAHPPVVPRVTEAPALVSTGSFRVDGVGVGPTGPSAAEFKHLQDLLATAIAYVKRIHLF